MTRHRPRPVSVHLRTGTDKRDGQKTYAIAVPRAVAEAVGDESFRAELLPGGTLVYRPMREIYEPVEPA